MDVQAIAVLTVTCWFQKAACDVDRVTSFAVQERVLPGRAAKLAATCALRFSNTFVGSAMWVACARMAGLQ